MSAKPARLKNQPIDDLMGMHSELNTELMTRIDGEMAELENRLQTLREFKARMTGAEFTGLKGRKISPKYRNPENPSETWAGRGMYPKWLEKALKGKGKKLDDFKIKD